MNNNVSEFLSKLTDFIKNEVKTDTVIGQPFQLGEFSCVPVIGVGFGIGAGGGEGKNAGHDEGAGAGGGAGMGMGPVGFLVTRKDQIQFVPTRQSKGLSSVFEKLPDLMEKYFEGREHGKKETAN